MKINLVEVSVFVLLFLLVTVLGFLASRWNKADLSLLDEWGLGGRKFGTIISWFLLGGDLYTAYTFIAVPALVFGSGAIGLFAIPYTIIVYPIVYVVMPKLWEVASSRGFVTASDYVKERFDSRWLALAIAITGIVATMPYIALQIFGIEVVISQMGIPVEISLIIAFLILAVFTYVSGLRAPALIAVVKDTLIIITILVAIVVIPMHLGGFSNIFSKVPLKKQNLPPALFGGYATLALGSALALFMYPHAITGVFSSRSQRVIKRNAALMPIYTLVLGLIALLGYMAIASGIHPTKPYLANGVIPSLLSKSFPAPFVGFAFAAIAIGALVPASIMSIAAANLFSRNVWKDFLRPNASGAEQSKVAKITSLLVKVGALAFILGAPTTYVINFQLAGGVWALQTIPAIVLALYVGWLDKRAVLLGWFVAVVYGTYVIIGLKFKSSLSTIPFFGPHSPKLYVGIIALVINLVIVFGFSFLAKALGLNQGEQLLPKPGVEKISDESPSLIQGLGPID